MTLQEDWEVEVILLEEEATLEEGEMPETLEEGEIREEILQTMTEGAIASLERNQKFLMGIAPK